MTRLELADSLADATPELLRGYARHLAQMEDVLDADGPLLATDTRSELHERRRCYRILGALALAVAEIDSGALYLTQDGMGVYLDNGVAPSVNAPTLPAALAALLREVSA